MNKQKPILILCNSYHTGKEYFMKHLAHVNVGKTVLDDDKWVDIYVIYNHGELEKTLRICGKVDIDGYILPEFKDNPERFSILDTIQSHKLCIRSDLAKDFHVKTFVEHRNSLKLTLPDREKLQQEETEQDILDHFFKQMAQP